MADLARGSEEALEALVTRHRATLIRRVARSVGDTGQAEDIAQETFLRVFQNAGTYEGKGQFLPWLRTIAARLCLNEARRERRHPEHPLEIAREATARASAEHAVQARQVRKALVALPTRQRLALLLKAVEGRSYQEIGQILECSQTDVANAIFRARKALARTLG